MPPRTSTDPPAGERILDTWPGHDLDNTLEPEVTAEAVVLNTKQLWEVDHYLRFAGFRLPVDHENMVRAMQAAIYDGIVDPDLLLAWAAAMTDFLHPRAANGYGTKPEADYFRPAEIEQTRARMLVSINNAANYMRHIREGEVVLYPWRYVLWQLGLRVAKPRYHAESWRELMLGYLELYLEARGRCT